MFLGYSPNYREKYVLGILGRGQAATENKKQHAPRGNLVGGPSEKFAGALSTCLCRFKEKSEVVTGHMHTSPLHVFWFCDFLLFVLLPFARLAVVIVLGPAVLATFPSCSRGFSGVRFCPHAFLEFSRNSCPKPRSGLWPPFLVAGWRGVWWFSFLCCYCLSLVYGVCGFTPSSWKNQGRSH